jgi:hypothetical protein
MEAQIHQFIRELNTTYDSNLFDNQSESLQQKCLDYSTINKNKDTKDTKGKVLMELLYNHYAKDKPTADFIGGPKTLSIHWHPQYKKIIYIFGEEHSNTMDCEGFKTIETHSPITVPIEDYLYDLMKSTDVFLDIYFEFPFYTSDDFRLLPEKRSSNQRLFNLFNTFKKCLIYDSRHKKSCRLARSHYFDIRHSSSNPLNLEQSKIDIVWVRSVLDLISKQSDRSKLVQIIKIFLRKSIVTDILRNLTDENNDNIYQFMLSQLKENRYIKKELGKIVENHIHLISAFDTFFYYEITKTMMFYDDKLVLNIDKIKRSVNTLLDYKTTSDVELYDNLNVFLKAISDILVCFADAYLLARVFKDFNMSEMDEKAYKGATHQPKRAHNIIIYAGDVHADNYRNFLSFVGFTEIDSYGIDLDNPNPYLSIPNMPRNCLDMRNIKQTFFSYKRYNLSSFNVIKQCKRHRQNLKV